MREKSCLPYSHSLLRYVSRWGCASSLLASREPAALLPTQPQQTLPSVKGTVRFEGVVPKPKVVSLAADPSCAKQHPSPFFAQEVMRDAQGDLQNVIIFVADGLGDRTFDRPTQPAIVEQKGWMYRPHVLAVRANQPLHVVNDDPTSHNLHPRPANNRRMEQSGAAGIEHGRIVFAGRNRNSGEVQFASLDARIHRSVQRSFLRSDRQARNFRPEQFAAGAYTIKAWHEKQGTSTQTITIGANVSFVFKGM
jgi:hypothetical protein